MQKKNLFNIAAIILFSMEVYAGVPAISSVYFDTGKVKSIYLAPTIPTLLEFPCNILSTLKDVAGNIEGAPDKENPRRLVIWLKAPQISTITVLCDNKVFVFKIEPSQEHQAYIKVLGSYGGPELADSPKSVLINSSSQAPKSDAKREPAVKKVLLSSEGKAK